MYKTFDLKVTNKEIKIIVNRNILQQIKRLKNIGAQGKRD